MCQYTTLFPRREIENHLVLLFEATYQQGRRRTGTPERRTWAERERKAREIVREGLAAMVGAGV